MSPGFYIQLHTHVPHTQKNFYVPTNVEIYQVPYHTVPFIYPYGTYIVK